jgi:hypothetical protein
MVDADEPLVHGAKDDGRFAAPTMRIAVMIILLVEERILQAQLMENHFVRVALTMFFENRFADHLGGHLLFARLIIGVSEAAIVIDR